MKKLNLWQQILIGMVLGLIVGTILGDSVFINQFLKPIGDIFISLIKMLVVPLIFCSLLTGITSMEGDLGRLGRISTRTFALYLISTAIAVSIGLIVANIFNPGLESSLTLPVEEVKKETKTLLEYLMETLKGIIPVNPIKSLSDGNILQIILFTLLLGISMIKLGEKARPVKKFFDAAAEVMYTLTALVMKVAPVGVFALMSWVAGKYGVKVLMPLIKLIITAYIASIIHCIFVIGGAAHIFAKIPFVKFFKGTSEPLSFAFVSTSSSGTLPLSISAVNTKLGVSRRICDFVLPLGATINMDGTAIYQGVCAIFIAQLYGIDLTTADYLTIVFTATLASIGTAGIPGAGLVMLSMVLVSVNLPLEGLLLISGVDRILDMARTSVNVLGDCMVAAVVARHEDEIDDEVIKGTK